MRKKLLLDAGTLVLLLLCMKYSLTGPLGHEITGVILFLGLIIHIVINRKYYRVLRPGKLGKLNVKAKISFAFNMLLPVSLLTMIMSSVVISKDVFRFIGIDTSHYEFWRILHIISAVAMIISACGHLIMHIKLFRSQLNKIDEKVPRRAAGVFSCAAAVVVGALALGSSADQISRNLTGSGEKAKPFTKEPSSDDIAVKESEGKEKGSVVTDVTGKRYEFKETTSDGKLKIDPLTGEALSLEDYLGKLICTGCGKKCSLLAPSCKKGEKQAKEAAEKFNQTYLTSQTKVSETTVVVTTTASETSSSSGESVSAAVSESESKESQAAVINNENPESISIRAEDAASLEDYLGKLICTGCPRQCSLLAPGCPNGNNQAEAAKEEYYKKHPSEIQNANENSSGDVIENPPAEEKPSLEDYLGKLICTGCPRGCSLLAPGCGKGEGQAREAEEQYNTLYNS